MAGRARPAVKAMVRPRSPTTPPAVQHAPVTVSPSRGTIRQAAPLTGIRSWVLDLGPTSVAAVHTDRGTVVMQVEDYKNFLRNVEYSMAAGSWRKFCRALGHLLSDGTTVHLRCAVQTFVLSRDVDPWLKGELLQRLQRSDPSVQELTAKLSIVTLGSFINYTGLTWRSNSLASLVGIMESTYQGASTVCDFDVPSFLFLMADFPDLFPGTGEASSNSVVRVLGTGGESTVFEIRIAGKRRALKPHIKSTEFDILQHVLVGPVFPRVWEPMKLGGQYHCMMTVMEHLNEAVSIIPGNGRALGQLVIDVLRDVSAQLAYLHENGIVHRDVKPANIMTLKRSGGLQRVLIDFGLGCGPDGQSKYQLRGTTTYADPWLFARGAEAANDVWSLAVTVVVIVLTLNDQTQVQRLQMSLSSLASKLRTQHEIRGRRPVGGGREGGYSDPREVHLVLPEYTRTFNDAVMCNPAFFVHTPQFTASLRSLLYSMSMESRRLSAEEVRSRVNGLGRLL
ncbi:MAG: hypothetical protein KVP17_003307 [Porospora cf. gigantea B]|uniref:uncharacterized protein n=1 Tax=Porospora cf. gigantea B TaxID=2853592 RepID=UPI0035718167|nr:MAG: hypothetical protein KVP17_003307 [Porospora cf. gigantea B]